jgi:hypothetical protein
MNSTSFKIIASIVIVVFWIWFFCLIVQRETTNDSTNNGQNIPTTLTTTGQITTVYTSKTGDKVYEVEYRDGLFIYIAEDQYGNIKSITRF